MLEALLAALAMFFAPHADQVRQSEPLVELMAPICSMPPDPSSGYKPPPPTFVHIDRDGALRVNDEPQRFETLGAALKAKACHADGECDRIFVWADYDTPYTTVLSAISVIKHNGFDKIGLISAEEPA